tara:strand:+ start:33789 stop:34136 length:348 start_codon:yes stop_codon:yes gene_type:complete
MKNKLAMYQNIKNDSQLDNLAVNIFKSIKNYILEGVKYDKYEKIVRQKNLANASNLCLTTLEHLNYMREPELGLEVANVLNATHKVCAAELKEEKTQNFSEIFKSLDILINLSKK